MSKTDADISGELLMRVSLIEGSLLTFWYYLMPRNNKNTVAVSLLARFIVIWTMSQTINRTLSKPTILLKCSYQTCDVNSKNSCIQARTVQRCRGGAMGLASKCDMKHCSTNSKHRHIGEKESLWPWKYAKNSFWARAPPRIPWGNLNRKLPLRLSPRHLVGEEGTPFPMLHPLSAFDASILLPSALSTQHINWGANISPQIVCSTTALVYFAAVTDNTCT